MNSGAREGQTVPAAYKTPPLINWWSPSWICWSLPNVRFSNISVLSVHTFILSLYPFLLISRIYYTFSIIASNMTGATCVGGTAYYSSAPELNSVFVASKFLILCCLLPDHVDYCCLFSLFWFRWSHAWISISIYVFYHVLINLIWLWQRYLQFHSVVIIHDDRVLSGTWIDDYLTSVFMCVSYYLLLFCFLNTIIIRREQNP